MLKGHSAVCRAPVTGLAYSPKDHMAASVSGDGRLAIWQRVAARPGPSAAHTPSTTWRCFSTSTYRGTVVVTKAACVLLPQQHLPGVCGHAKISLVHNTLGLYGSAPSSHATTVAGSRLFGGS